MLEFQFSPSEKALQSENNFDDFFNNVFQSYLKTIDLEEIGFMRLPFQSELIEECQKLHRDFSSKSIFVQVGIGGSSLGPEMLLSSLSSRKKHSSIYFLNNIDSVETHEIFEQAGLFEKEYLEKTLFYVVSKSGGTAETIANFTLIMNHLKSLGIEESRFHEFFVFATDPQKSQLLELAKAMEIKCLTIPSNIGGRFSVFTPVGFLPALFAGIDVEALVQGAQAIEPKLKEIGGDLDQYARFIWNEYQTGSQINVMMPYSSKLRDFGFWYNQLWAESLGKKHNRKQEKLECGLTPIPAYGPTDQHSQMQLFMEGPRDKVIQLIEVANPKQDFNLTSGIDLPSFTKLKDHTLNELMKAELEGTKQALKAEDRAFVSLKLDQLNEQSLGGLILFFEALTALVGEYFDINAFDQPGVELGKKYAFEYLKG